MVYMEPVHVGINAIIDTWSQGYVEDLLPEQVSRLVDMIKEHVPHTLKWIRANTNEVGIFRCAWRPAACRWTVREKVARRCHAAVPSVDLLFVLFLFGYLHVSALVP